ncbi:MAG: AAA family ATPase [Planctomycetota bacterium]|nr:AAA family ATPase [Planctomycetota bacterium]
MTPTSPDRIASLQHSLAGLRESIGRVFLGQEETVELLLLSLLADGHVLLEGAPGLGKTTLVRALSSALDLSFQRVQFTPDLMPGDIIGTRMLEGDAGGERHFRFVPGPIFCQVLLADEINRATPRTQSALLEAMQEKQITTWGESRKLDRPFLVIATQNPIEMEGTYSLPEAQLDRFVTKIEVASPGEDDLVQILAHTTGATTEAVPGKLKAQDLIEAQALVRELPASTDILHRVARLVLATDPRRPASPRQIQDAVRFGSSPRGGQALLLLAKARAFLASRPFVTDEDIEAVAAPALRHRLVLSYEGEASGIHTDRLVAAAAKASAKAPAKAARRE